MFIGIPSNHNGTRWDRLGHPRTRNSGSTGGSTADWIVRVTRVRIPKGNRQKG